MSEATTAAPGPARANVAGKQWKSTACILCECNCGIEVAMEGRTLAQIRGDKAHHASQGYTCNKAMRLDHYQNGTHRLTSPLRRRPDGSYEEIDWDTAIREVAAGFKRLSEEHGGESIFYYGGGGQGNHLGGAYSSAFLKALGSRHRSNALAQEKTGEGWIDSRISGGHTRGEFEHSEVAVFVGKNPWMSQSFPRARLVLREISKDPERSMIVLDPVVTDTAKMADFHLQVKPGADSWCLAAMVATLVQEDLIDHEFIAEHVNGAEQVLAEFSKVPIDAYADRCGVEADLIRAAARRIGEAESVGVFEDLGVQQAPNSTLNSYINKMLWILTGSFGRQGTQHLHSWMAPLFGSGKVTHTPVTGAPIIGSLMPCNVIPDEILSDDPNRFRGLLVESANPAHSLADSRRMREALESLEHLVVIDVAMTETARLADYVLPAASQFEKCEATFFCLEFPENSFHLRPRLMEPLEGTLPEPEIHARLMRELAPIGEDVLGPIREAAQQGLDEFIAAFGAAAGADPMIFKLAPWVLYETLGQTLPEGLEGAAAVWGLAQRVAMTYPDAMQRAGHPDGNALFQAIIDAGAPGVIFTRHEQGEDFGMIQTPEGRFEIGLDDMLEGVARLQEDGPHWTSDEFPIVLSVGERRGYTANTIFRSPEWRKRDRDGALRLSVADADSLGLVDGERVRVTTASGVAETLLEVNETMQAGHASLPNGYGLDYRTEEGELVTAGIAPNELTSTDWRDEYAGTPWHKHVPARIERL